VEEVDIELDAVSLSVAETRIGQEELPARVGVRGELNTVALAPSECV